MAKQYKTDRKAFEAQAKEWTEKYASEKLEVDVQEDKIKTLTDLGLKRDHARAALVQHGWDTEAAANSLLG